MKGLIRTLTAIGAASLFVGVAFAQTNQGSVGPISVQTGDETAPPDWMAECTDPTNTTPLSNPYIINYIANELMWCSFGGEGTWTAGGTTTNGGGGPCFDQSEASNNSGMFAISYGNYEGAALGAQAAAPQASGSVQQYTPNFRNAGMAIQYGAPYTPSYCCANFLEDGAQSFFGGNFTEFFFGQSNRYMTGISTVGNITVDLQVELVADAVRFRWTCTNNDTTPHTLALMFGSGINMLTDQNSKYWPAGGYAVGNFGQPYFQVSSGGTIGYGPDLSGDPPYFNYFTNFDRLARDEVPDLANTTINGFLGAFIYTPNQRPPDQDTIYQLTTTNTSLFPDYVDFDFDESDPFGIRIETKPSSSTNDTNPTNLPNKADFVMVGKALYVFGPLTGDDVFPLENPFPDTGFLSQPAFVIEYDPQEIQPGTTYQFLNYVRSTWGNGDYKLPFGAVVDAPAIVQGGSLNFDGTAAPSGLVNNTVNDPVKIRITVDNVGGNVTSGYGVNDKEFTLDNVEINLTFNTPGIHIINGPATQVISEIAPRTDAHVDFQCLIDQTVVGNLNYTVTINTVPVNQKIITGTINVAGRPQNMLYPGPNLITAPYAFQDGSWLTILQDYVPGGAKPPVTGTVASTASFQTYVWDPERQTYNISLTSQRTGAVWVVYDNPSAVFAPYEGTPEMPATYSSSTFQIELKSGWNMVANPFNIVYQMNEVNGVAEGDSTQVYTYDELVSLGYISGFVASYDPTLNNFQGGYDYTDGTQGFLQPNVGYWIDDLLPGDLTLSFPPLYTEGTPGSLNKTPTTTLAAGLWRIGLSARQGLKVDNNVVVGTASSASDVRAGTIYKAPMAPTQSLNFAILGKQGTKSVYLNQALTTSAKSYSWTADLSSTKTGEISLTWPSTSTVPKSLGIYIQDLTSGITTDMRAQSSYSFYELEPGSRQFKIFVTPTENVGGLIASLTATPLTVGKEKEEKISYTLRAHATTTLKVYSANGALVAQLHGPQVDGLGETSFLWNMESSAGKKVLAGKYTVVLSGLTDTGEVQSKSIVIEI